MDNDLKKAEGEWTLDDHMEASPEFSQTFSEETEAFMEKESPEYYKLMQRFKNANKKAAKAD